jgi:hypothetical protein
MQPRRPTKCQGSGEQTGLWTPVDRSVTGNQPAVKKCPHCGESLRLIKEGGAYRFPAHERPDSEPE